ncbi:MAG: malic enzyme-like NAD(P)-binding protein, partial [Arcobacteraceae bacterium]
VRSDFLKQEYNCLGHPSIFKEAMKERASEINEEMKLAAANAIASVIPEDQLNEENIIPNVFHPEVMKKEAEAVAQAAMDTGVARI